MDLCPSAGDGVTEARRPTRRLIGGFSGQFSVMPRTSASTYQWRRRNGFDDGSAFFTAPTHSLLISTGQNWPIWQPPSRRSRPFFCHPQYVFMIDGGKVTNWTGGFGLLAILLSPYISLEFRRRFGPMFHRNQFLR